MQFYEKYLDIAPEVRDALLYNKPVVALDSSMISHGIPYPENIKTAIKTEEIIRENGAIPATIAILNGRLKVGLTLEEIEYLGKGKSKIIKANRRDIPFVVSKKLDGSTTVASTMIIASFAGINIFSTGGIGGVHRGAHLSFDVSSDLKELSCTNVAVVCSGPKLITDAGPTIEYLETHGIPILGYQTNELPGFYTRKSEFRVDYRADKPESVAESLKVKWDLGLTGGVIVANPVSEEYSIDKRIIDKAINCACNEVIESKLKGNLVTPYLLKRINEITDGQALKSNIQIIYRNAKLAAQIAKEYCNIR